VIPADRATEVAGAHSVSSPGMRVTRSRLVRVSRCGRLWSSVALRLRVATRRDALDRALAAGVDPSTDPELAFRAARLVRERDRRALASCLRLVVGQADGEPWLARSSPREIKRCQIVADRQSVVSLIDRLESARPAVAEGVAIAERLLTDLHSPLFAWAEPGTLRRLALNAVAAMDPPPCADGDPVSQRRASVLPTD
jgi:hypothetical protein